MNSKDFITMIMNPTRQRIIEYLILHEKGTPKEIQEALNDIPTASLYRHIRALYEGGCLDVTDEKKIRGTVEKTYTLVKQPFGESPDPKDMESMFVYPLMSLVMSFQNYFQHDHADPVKDMLSLSTSTLMLSDDEFLELTGKIGEIITEYIENSAIDGRKARRFTFISSPCEE